MHTYWRIRGKPSSLLFNFMTFNKTRRRRKWNEFKLNADRHFLGLDSHFSFRVVQLLCCTEKNDFLDTFLLLSSPGCKFCKEIIIKNFFKQILFPLKCYHHCWMIPYRSTRTRANIRLFFFHRYDLLLGFRMTCCHHKYSYNEKSARALLWSPF